ncbi:MAG: DUF1385 domain-containing protein [Fimbriimonadaceae bacterium]|nr:DUF1385 domain-containing protein [Fimbriimonadaceae bacterium]
MAGNPLAHPVGALLRFAETAHLGQSLEVAASKLRHAEGGLVVVLDEPVLAGIVTEASLAQCLAEGMVPDDPLDAAVRPARVIAPHATGADALRRFDEDPSTLVVADEHGRVLGILAPSDLFPKFQEPIRPPAIGGMATPFGVYLTTGAVSAGAGHFALVTTGMLLFTLFFGAATISDLLATRLWMQGLSESWANAMRELLPVGLFLLGMRLLPLAGTHASEHMVVHAIERGERLEPQTVKRMPRVHPRCGTNLAVGAAVFLGLFHAGFIPDEQLRLLVAGLATLMLWRPLGGAMQWFVTTKPPTDRQVQSAVRTGQELLDRYQTVSVVAPAFPMRLWRSGLFHVMGGALLAGAAVAWLSGMLGLEIPI